MRRDTLWVLLSCGFVLLVLLACKGKGSSASSGPEEPASALSTTRKDYVGDWTASDAKLSIAENGSLSYEKTGGVKKTYTGTVKSFQGDDIVVNALITVTLKVSAAPHKVGSEWRMTVEGDELKRASPNAIVEKEIQSDFASKSISVKEVKCPDDRSSDNFDCDLTTSEGTTVPVHVTIEGKGARWKMDAAMMDGKIIEKAITDRYAARKKTVTAKCPPGIIVKNPGETFTCDATPSSGAPLKVTVHVKDNKGEVTLDLP